MLPRVMSQESRTVDSLDVPNTIAGKVNLRKLWVSPRVG